MFPVFPTAVAILSCVAGLDMALSGSGPPLSLWALVLLAVAPLGELLVLLAKLRRRSGGAARLALPGFVLTAVPPASYAAAMLFFGLPRIAILFNVDGWVLIDDLLLLLPYLAASSLGRHYNHRLLSVFDATRTRHHRRTELLLGIKGEAVIVVPFFCLVLLDDLIRSNESVRDAFANEPVLVFGLAALTILLLSVFFPSLVRLVWRLKPLAGTFPDHEELTAFMRRERFRVRDILVWRTGGLLINAAILGFLPRWRYILFTDSMLRLFETESLKAALAHEMGHGKRKHTAFFILFAAAFFMALLLIDSRFQPLAFIEDEILASLVFFGPPFLIFWIVLFGCLSRRFEVEADIYAARAVGDPALFIKTLDLLGVLSRQNRSRTTLRHFSIDTRIALLRTFFPEPSTAAEGSSGCAEPEALLLFQKRMKRLKMLILAFSFPVILLFLIETAF